MKQTLVAMILVGGKGTRLKEITKRHGETRRVFRREIPPDRLHAVQPRQLATSTSSGSSRSTNPTS
ncbi:MAG: hypothetical protein MZU97_06830 [Bacillus subtilis]|nr:hypothetical protein [Bacillus subtilis]